MPDNYTETSAWITPIAGPANGDLADDASIDGLGQALTSRTRYLYDIVGPSAVGSKRRYEVADVTALKAVTGMASGDWAQSSTGLEHRTDCGQGAPRDHGVQRDGHT